MKVISGDVISYHTKESKLDFVYYIRGKWRSPIIRLSVFREGVKLYDSEIERRHLDSETDEDFVALTKQTFLALPEKDITLYFDDEAVPANTHRDIDMVMGVIDLEDSYLYDAVFRETTVEICKGLIQQHVDKSGIEF